LMPDASLSPIHMPNWKCENCGKIHGRNPSACNSCGHAVLQQTDEPSGLLDRLWPW
jgi:rRNA maturation endonuclease Nob1